MNQSELCSQIIKRVAILIIYDSFDPQLEK